MPLLGFPSAGAFPCFGCVGLKLAKVCPAHTGRSRTRVPDLHGPVQASGGDPRAVRTERRRSQAVGVPDERAEIGRGQIARPASGMGSASVAWGYEVRQRASSPDTPSLTRAHGTSAHQASTARSAAQRPAPLSCKRAGRKHDSIICCFRAFPEPIPNAQAQQAPRKAPSPDQGKELDQVRYHASAPNSQRGLPRCRRALSRTRKGSGH